MVTMKSLVTLVLTALVLASSMAVVASDHKGGADDGRGGPDDPGGKPDDAGSPNGQGNGGKPDDAGSPSGQGNGGTPGDAGAPNGQANGGKPDGAGAPNDQGNHGKPDDAGSPNGADEGGKPDDAGSPNGQGAGAKPDHAGSPDGADNGGKPDDAGSPKGQGKGGTPDDAGPPDGAGNGGKPNDAGPPDGQENAGGGRAGPGTGPVPSGQEDRPGAQPKDDQEPPLSERGRDRSDGTPSDPAGRSGQEPTNRPDRGRDSLRTQGSGPDPVPAVVEDAADGFRTARTADSPRPRVDFDARAVELTLETDSETPGLTSRIDGLVEYLDDNGNDAYDIGEPVLDRIPVRDLEPVIRHGAEGADTREVVYTLPGGGTLALIFHLGTSGQIGAKYDILVVDHPFHDPESRLAIGVSAAVDGGVRLLEIDGQPAVAGQDGDDVSYLRWVTVAIVDGDTAPVGWSVHISHSETVESAIIYWSYPQGMRILHDPEVGITHLPPDLLGDSELFVYGLVLTGTTLLVGHEFRRRRAW